MITLFLIIVNRAKKCRRAALFFDYSLFFSTSAGVIFEILRMSSIEMSIPSTTVIDERSSHTSCLMRNTLSKFCDLILNRRYFAALCSFLMSESAV